MPHSLRVRLKNLNYKGLLTDREFNRLVNALDTVDSIEDIKADISDRLGLLDCKKDILAIIDKYTSGADMRGDTDENRN